MLGSFLSAVVIISLLAIGCGGIVAPRIGAAQYGIVLDDRRSLAFLRAMAVRDLVIGGLLGLLALRASREALGWGMGISVVVAALDFVLVVADRRTALHPAPVGTRMAAPVLHAAGAAALVGTAAVLIAGW